MRYEVDYKKPLDRCTPDELEHADEEGCWLYYGDVQADSEDDALARVSEDHDGWETRIHDAC
jgi:hypothetical protein